MRVAPVVIAQQEDLGDLKLYRIPETVTVAANAQKQVALLIKDRVPYERIYQLKPGATAVVEDPRPVPIVLRMKNTKAERLGLPLPSGRVALFETAGDRPMLIGEPRIDDKAVGEDVELDVGESPDVTYIQRWSGPAGETPSSDRPQRYEIEVSNARATPAVVEVELRINVRQELVKPSRRLGIKNGRHFWRALIPANGRMALSYTIRPLARKGEQDDENAED
jgi:hypothetical protein